MGWLSSFFGSKPTKIVKLEGDGDFECEVVGESRYQEALSMITGGKTKDGHEFECEAKLIREPDNRFDPNAVFVTIDGMKVGYLSREHAVTMAAIFKEHGLAEARADAVIVGGWKRKNRTEDEGNFGVRLDIPIH
jgi:HIRAN domain